MVWGLMLIGSADSISAELPSGVPALFTTSGTKGLGSTPASTVWVPACRPPGVLGLQPVGLWVVPNEIVPPATPT